ncbi:MAG: LysR family transcriptional regulator [Myxococcales bacterium]|nr:LysR family transcriptional regulator [Myxococcales bacterium]MCB9641708.1 LysR family transcriptional regulator [Myxococcales bacterium]
MRAIQDLNLLYALDALLQEESVTKAAGRANMTTPAMSRALGRLRLVLGDMLLVRAGRGMVLTPFAVSLRERVHETVQEACGLLSPDEATPLVDVERVLAIRCNDAVAAALLGPLLQWIEEEAPKLRLRFLPEGDEDVFALREGRVELDIGVIDFLEPEIRVMKLFEESFVGLARKDHPLFQEPVSPMRLALQQHLSISRKGRFQGPLDQALAELSLERSIQAVVPDFLSALFAVASSSLVCALPLMIANYATSFLEVRAFELPIALPKTQISLAWHPRFDKDNTHRWLRQKVQRLMKERLTGDRTGVI